MSNCGGCASARDRCGNGLEKVYPTTAVRYGKMGYIGEFSHDPDVVFTCGGRVVIQTDRGIEVGQQVSLTCNGCEKSVSRDQMRVYAKASGSDSYRLKNGHILREATPGDLAELRHLQDAIFDKIQTCRRMVEELNLPMKVVDAEHIFGGERVIFYFMSEDRIDFRELVRLLAREFQTRIEMRQVGARDEARLLADYETCGRECCCKSFLKTLKPVGMQMAKLQKATLDPSKVSGRCGRLKCCLRYEHESYSDLNKRLPRLGRRVRTETDEGVVIDRQILTQLLKLRKDDGKVVTVCDEDLIERDLPAPPPPPSMPPADANGGGRPERRRSEPAGDGRQNRRPHREARSNERSNEPRSAGPRGAQPGPRQAGTDANAAEPDEIQPDAAAPDLAEIDPNAGPTSPPMDADQAGIETDRPESRPGHKPSQSPPGPDRTSTGQGNGPSSPGSPRGSRGRGRHRRRRGGGKGPGPTGSSPPRPA